MIGQDARNPEDYHIQSLLTSPQNWLVEVALHL